MTTRIEFSRSTKLKRFEFAKGCCEGKDCGKKLQVGDIEYDHDKEAEDGGDNSFENCRVLCRACHREKTTAFVKRIRKADRSKAAHLNARPVPKKRLPSCPFPSVEKPARIEKKTLPYRKIYERADA